MPDDPLPLKSALREQALGRRMLIPAALRRHFSRLIAGRLHALLSASHPQQRTLLLYIAMPHEVDTAPVRRWRGYRMYAPRMHGHARMDWHRIGPETQWRRSRWGVEEPADGELWRPDIGGVLLCPLTAFDRHGNRLGMGKGCFDIWLGHHRSALAAVIGLAFACQEVASVPHEAHDVPMDFVITEKETIACRS